MEQNEIPKHLKAIADRYERIKALRSETVCLKREIAAIADANGLTASDLNDLVGEKMFFDAKKEGEGK